MDEFGPLLRVWLRLRCGTIADFWDALPWEVAAAIGLGPYAPPETPQAPTAPGMRGPTGPQRRRVASTRASHPFPRSQEDLIRQRLAHAADPENVPAPRIIGPGVAGMEGLVDGPFGHI